MIENPDSPTIREALYERWQHPHEKPTDYSVEMAEALGLDPDMTLAELHSKLTATPVDSFGQGRLES